MQRVFGHTTRFARKGLVMPPRAFRARRAGSRVWLRAFVLALLLAGLGLFARQLAVHELEVEGIEVKALGRENPMDFGVPFQTLALPMQGRVLQARLVAADQPTAHAVLIFHGNGESISDWARVQAHLHDAGIASMVFDYSGFGSSTGTPSVVHLHEDARAAYRAFVAQWPQARARYVLGHSLGNAVMLEVLPELRPALAGVVVHAGFTSAREMATRTGLASPWLAQLLPDLWDSETAMVRRGPPMLVMHSDADEVIPPQMGQRLADAAGARAHFVGLRGFRHDSLYQDVAAEQWQPIIDFIRGGNQLAFSP